MVGNLQKTSLKRAWESSVMDVVRKRLHREDRDFGPCRDCSVNGLLQGREQYEQWLSYTDDLETLVVD